MVRHRLPLSSALGGHWVITGAGRGIGAALAREVRHQWPHARLSLVDLDGEAVSGVARELEGAAFEADLTRLELLPAVVARATERFGPIDVLVNNAGVMWVGDATVFSQRRTETLLALDLLAPIRLSQLVGRSMQRRGSGVLVNIASLAGVTPLRGCTVYAAAKAGIAHYSETLRAELLPHGIQVMTVYPGPVRTELERRARRGLRGTWVSRAAPVGRPDVLAALLCLALRQGKARVIYPRSYELAWRFPRFASWLTTRFSPPPQSNPEEAGAEECAGEQSEQAGPHASRHTLAHSG